MRGNVSSDQCGAELARFKAGLLNIDRSDLRSLDVVQHGKIDCARQMICGELARTSDVDDIGEDRERNFIRAIEVSNHAPSKIAARPWPPPIHIVSRP